MAPEAERSYEMLSDLALAACAARREAGAIRLVTQRNNQRLFRAAWSILRNRAEAEDAVQEASVRAFTAIAGFNGLSSLSTWLTRILINEALMRRRAAKRRAAALNGSSVVVIDEYREKLMGSSEQRATPEQAVMRAQLAKLLEGAVGQLPEPYRLVFMLREIEGLSVEETADTLRILPQTVKTRALRARHRLQKLLDPELKNALGDAFPFAGADCESLTQRVLARLDHSGETNGGEAP